MPGVALYGLVLSLAAASALPLNHSVVLIGGGETGADALTIFAAIARLGGGGGARFCVLGAAAGSGAPAQDAAYCARLATAGVTACYPVPIDATGPGRSNASNPTVVAQLRACTGFFIVGGDQMSVLQALFDDDPPHTPTPALTAIRDALSLSGGVVAGTSAGTVIGGGNSYYALLNGVHEWVPGDPQNDEPANLTAFLPGGLAAFGAALVDAHLAQRGRQGRQLRLLLDTRGTPAGARRSVGIDENTAFVVERDSGRGAVIGAGGVLVYNVDGAQRSAGAACANVSATRLTEGDSVDLGTWDVTPAPFKVSLHGREHRAAAATSDDVFAEGGGGGGGGAQFQLVATSVVDTKGASASSWGATPADLQPRLNVTFSRVAGVTAAYDGTHPVSGRYAISYTDLRVDVGVAGA